MRFIKIENAFALLGILIALGAWLYPFAPVAEKKIEVKNTGVNLEAGEIASGIISETEITQTALKDAPSATVLKSNPTQTILHPQPELKQSRAPVINVHGNQNISGDLVLGNKIAIQDK